MLYPEAKLNLFNMIYNDYLDSKDLPKIKLLAAGLPSVSPDNAVKIVIAEDIRDVLVYMIMSERIFKDIDNLEDLTRGFVDAVVSKSLTQEEAFLLYLDVNTGDKKQTARRLYLGKERADKLLKETP